MEASWWVAGDWNLILRNHISGEELAQGRNSSCTTLLISSCSPGEWRKFWGSSKYWLLYWTGQLLTVLVSNIAEECFGEWLEESWALPGILSNEWGEPRAAEYFWRVMAGGMKWENDLFIFSHHANPLFNGKWLLTDTHRHIPCASASVSPNCSDTLLGYSN